MQHLEFFDIDHFENFYERVPPHPELAPFIDFFWETKFDSLWERHPKGFSDAQFSNIGYTYLLNLGTPFVMQVGEKKIPVKADGFLPRANAIECFHKPGNHLFGIKFRISPVILEKKINFSEYKEYIYPLSYLLDPVLIEKVKRSSSFEKRVKLLSNYFIKLIQRYENTLQPARLVSSVLDQCFQRDQFTLNINSLAQQYSISVRTLQRYFELCTGLSTKQALQLMRIRKATALLANDPDNFNSARFGYYDHSHFHKHLKQFMSKTTLKTRVPYLQLLVHNNRALI